MRQVIRFLARFAVFAVLLGMGSSRAAEAGLEAGGATNYAAEIVKRANSRDWHEAIAAAAKYEQELLSRYAAPLYEMGLLQSEAEHLSMHVAFDGWKQVDVAGFMPVEALRGAGFTFPLALEGASEQERFVVFCLNVSRMSRTMGTGETDAMFDSAQALPIVAQILASNCGRIENSRYKSVGGHNVFVVDVAPPFLGPKIRFALLNGRDFVLGVMMLSSEASLAKNEELMLESIKTASFDYNLPDPGRTASERAQCDVDDVSRVLECVEKLAAMRAYCEAAGMLADMRLSFYKRLPGMSVNGNVAHCPAYGLKLTNPDPSRWTLSVQEEGITKVMILEDKQSVNQEGIGVGVVDLVMAYGPEFLGIIEGDDDGRQALVSCGRGGAMFVGQIESERFVTINGKPAYEAVVVPNFPGVKGRVQVSMESGHALMLFLIGDERDFQKKVAEYDRVLETCLAFN